jgi:hypothetical protein
MMSRFGDWKPDISSWRTFDAPHLRSDNDLLTLKGNVERELQTHEYPAMLDKHALVMKEIDRRQEQAAGILPSQLRQRAVIALERIAAELESSAYDRAHIAHELSSISESLDESAKSDGEISRLLSDIRDKFVDE